MRRWFGGCVGAVVVSLVFAGGASAAVTGLGSVERNGVLDSATTKSVTATCPAGKQLVGAAAGKTFEAGGQVRMLALRPSSDLRSVVSIFREDETGFGGTWQATSYALCSTPLTGMQRVAVTSASNSVAKSVTATCPSGKRLIGVGGETAGGQGQVVLDVLRPNQGLTAAVVSAREDRNGFAGNWTAHCVRGLRGRAAGVGAGVGEPGGGRRVHRRGGRLPVGQGAGGGRRRDREWRRPGVAGDLRAAGQRAQRRAPTPAAGRTRPATTSTGRSPPTPSAPTAPCGTSPKVGLTNSITVTLADVSCPTGKQVDRRRRGHHRRPRCR